MLLLRKQNLDQTFFGNNSVSQLAFNAELISGISMISSNVAARHSYEYEYN